MTKKEREYKVQFIVDYTNIDDWADIPVKMAVAKIENGFGISKSQFSALLGAIVEDTINMLFEGGNVVIRRPDGSFVKGMLANTNETPVEKKKPCFLKRMWEKIKQLFSKKKKA